MLNTKNFKLFLLFIFFQSFQSYLFSQELNVYVLSVDNKKTNTDLDNLTHFLFLDADIKLNTFNISHYTSIRISDTTWVNKKKKAIYRNFKLDCDFNLASKFNFLYDANRIHEQKNYKNFLLTSTESISNLRDIERFILKEINTNSEIAIQREINKIKTENAKIDCNIYVVLSNYQSTKPEINFELDSILTNGQTEIKYKTNSKPKKIIWSSNVKPVNNNFEKPIINVTSNQKISVSYVDENDCKSDQDELIILYKEDCNCEIENGKPEILYSKSPNIVLPQDGDDTDWDYKAIPEQSGSLKFEFVVKNVCADRFIIEIRYPSGNILFKDIYEREMLDERSMNSIAVENKNYLVFTIPLDDKRNEIIDPNAYFLVNIIPEFSKSECTQRKFTSKRIRFSKCR